MDVANSSDSRPEDVLREMAAGSEEIGARLLRLAGAAAAVHRANILDLLSDDAPAPAQETDPSVHVESVEANPEPHSQIEERDECSPRVGVHIAAAIRRTEVAR